MQILKGEFCDFYFRWNFGNKNTQFLGQNNVQKDKNQQKCGFKGNLVEIGFWSPKRFPTRNHKIVGENSEKNTKRKFRVNRKTKMTQKFVRSPPPAWTRGSKWRNVASRWSSRGRMCMHSPVPADTKRPCGQPAHPVDVPGGGLHPHRHQRRHNRNCSGSWRAGNLSVPVLAIYLCGLGWLPSGLGPMREGGRMDIGHGSVCWGVNHAEINVEKNKNNLWTSSLVCESFAHAIGGDVQVV